jgi:transcriptional regulator with XRE-family HTH domain
MKKLTGIQDREIAALLLSHRKAKGLTQKEVAERARVTMREYGRFETCERSLVSSHYKTAMAVLQALDINSRAFCQKYVDGTPRKEVS